MKGFNWKGLIQGLFVGVLAVLVTLTSVGCVPKQLEGLLQKEVTRIVEKVVTATPEAAPAVTEATLEPTEQAPEPTEQPPEPTATATVPTPSAPTTYTVQKGDSLGKIAGQYGLTVEEIAAANNIEDINLLEVGQELIIPTPGAAPKAPQATATSTLAAPPPAAGGDWATFCHPSPIKEGEWAASLEMGARIEIEGYLYVKSASLKRGQMMAFTLRGIPYQSGTDWSKACKIHLFIPIGSGPNHVVELPSTFSISDVVVWDKTGREVRGWTRSLDSRRVRVLGEVAKRYGSETGLQGSNTMHLVEIELLD